MTRIVMKVVTKAKKDCHSLTKPSNKGTPEDTPGDMNDGSRRFRTSNVMAKAKTPSLKASVLAVSFAPRLSPFSMGWIPRDASGRFEGAAGGSDGVWVSSSRPVRLSFHGWFAITSSTQGEASL